MLEAASFFVWVTGGGARVLGALSDETRLDESTLTPLGNYVATQQFHTPSDRLLANPAIYRAAGRVRLPRSQGLLSLEPSEALDATLAAAARGATVEELASALTGDEVSLEEAIEFVCGLVERELLVGDAASPKSILGAMPPQQKSPPRPWARGEASLSRDAVEDLRQQILSLREENAHSAAPSLHDFVHAFVRRFGDDEVPLLFAVDPEAGVPFRAGAPSRFAGDVVVAHCRLEGERLALLGEGAFSLVSDDEPLATPLRRLLAAEEALHPGAVFAELRCAGDPPRARVRDFEIACLTAPTAPPEAQLPLSDLRLAVVEERLVLRSARLGREVVPRRAAGEPSAGSSDLAALFCALQQSAPFMAPAGAHLEIPFVRGTPHPPARAADPPIRRFFTPGSEWCELQLFGATTALDKIVVSLLAPLAARARDAALIDCWFFLRGEAHLAVAMQGPPARRGDLLALVEELAAPLLEDGRLHEFALCPYRRQVARFGGTSGILVAERLFEADSDAAVALLDALELDDRETRAALTLFGIDALFHDLGLTLDEKRAAIARSASFAKPRDTDARLVSEDERLLAADEDHPLAPGIAVVRARSSRIEPLVAELRALAANGHLSRSLAEVAPDFAHFFANRMSGSLEEEQALYRRLRRSYWKEESPR